MKIVALEGKRANLSDTSISSSLSLPIFRPCRCAQRGLWLRACNKNVKESRIVLLSLPGADTPPDHGWGSAGFDFDVGVNPKTFDRRGWADTARLRIFVASQKIGLGSVSRHATLVFSLPAIVGITKAVIKINKEGVSPWQLCRFPKKILYRDDS